MHEEEDWSSMSDQEDVPLCPVEGAKSKQKNSSDQQRINSNNNSQSVPDPVERSSESDHRLKKYGSESNKPTVDSENAFRHVKLNLDESDSNDVKRAVSETRRTYGPKSILKLSDSRRQFEHESGPPSEQNSGQNSNRWGKRLSSRISDLRMRSIGSDPKLSVTSYGKLEEDRIIRNTASFPALMHLIRAFICCGFLSLPYAVKLAGLVVGTIAILCTGLVTTIAVYLLIVSAKKMQLRCRMSYLDYGQVFEAACIYGPKPFRKCKKVAKLSINIPMAIGELGVCSAYILFVAENIQQVVEAYITYQLNIHAYIGMVVVLLIPLGMIKSPKSLTYISITGNVVLFAGLIIIFYSVSKNIYAHADIAALPQSASFSKTLMAICLTLFALEGIGFVLPLEGQMENPDDMLGWNGVLVTGNVFITFLYAAVGFFGFLAFGLQIKATVTLNLPQEPLYSVLKIILAIMVLLTYTIQFYIATDIIYWGWLAQMTEDREIRRGRERLFRFFGVLLTACLASVVPHLAEFMSLVGAASGFPLAVIIPCIVDLLVRWPEKAKGSLGVCLWRVILDLFIVVFGILAMFAGVVVSVFEIIDAFKLAPP